MKVSSSAVDAEKPGEIGLRPCGVRLGRLLKTRQAGHWTRCESQWRRVHKYTRAIGLLDNIKRLLTGAKDDAETHAEGGEPVATPPGEEERETSTNAQMMGSRDEPWSGND